MTSVNYAAIGRALLHPTAAAVLDHIAKNGESSPVQIAQAIGEPLGNVSYHVKTLAGDRPQSGFGRRPMLEMTHTEPRRGAVEHFYALTAEAKS